MAGSGPKRLQKYLPGGLASTLSRRTDAVADLKIAWNSAVSEPLASHTHPVRYAGRVLYVHVDTPAWASRLRVQQPTIAADLRQQRGLGDLSEIRFRVVPVEAPVSAATTVAPARKSRISAKAATHIDRMADGIAQSELKAALKRLAHRSGERK